jgi:hypothetical protein
VDLGPGQVTVNTQTSYFGSSVWVTGNLMGTVVVPAGQTLNVGADPTSTTVIHAGRVSTPVSGGGLLNVASTSPVSADVHADLNVANVTLGTNVTLGPKTDGTATAFGSGSLMTVAISGPVTVSNSVTIANQTTLQLSSGGSVSGSPGSFSVLNLGTINFGTNDYFACSTCTVTNQGTIQVVNPDGGFNHSLTINAGIFDNQGLIRMTGYLPGTAINFGSGASVRKKGMAVMDGLAQPPWVQQVQSNAIVQAIANALGSQGLVTLALNASLYVPSRILSAGVAACVNVNLTFSVTGAAIGVCLVVAPNGDEGVVVSLSSGGAVPWPSDKDWPLKDLFKGFDYTIDAGGQVLWRAGSSSNQSFKLSTDVDGPAWCENGSLTGDVGFAGSHCWGPQDQVPFDLSTLPILQPGIHSAYLGVSTGAGASLGATLGYSVLITCNQWLGVTGQACPVTNASAPVNKSAPAITGTAAVGQTLNSTTGGWEPSSNVTGYGYQWLRCSSSNVSTCTAISGATNSQYTVVAADKGSWLSVAVTATNVTGSTTSPRASPAGAVP